MALPPLVRFPEEIDAVLPHDPCTYDSTTFEGMEKDDKNADFCRDAVVAILDYEEQNYILQSTEHDTAAELYLRARTYYNDRCGRTARRLKALQDAEELEQDAKSKTASLKAHSAPTEPSAANEKASAPQTSNNNTVVHKIQEKTASRASIAGNDIQPAKSWSFAKETPDELKMSGFSWAKIAHLKSLNPANDSHSTLSKRRRKQRKQTDSATRVQAAYDASLYKLPPPRRKKSLEPV